MTRAEIRSNIAHAMYAYSTRREEVVWEGKRPGIVLPSVSATVKSCGGFRSWAILMAKGRLFVTIDGYRTRSNVYENRPSTCEIGVLVGDGTFVFPWNDSRTNHSLAMGCSGGKLVNVTSDNSVPWEQELVDLASELTAAAEGIDKAVKDYDAAKQAEREAIRHRESAEARQALLT